MPFADSGHCMACGKADGLQHCATCKLRMKDMGVGQALCTPCFQDADTRSMFASNPKAGEATFTCKPCSKFLERQQQETLFQELRGPSSEKILRTVADKFP